MFKINEVVSSSSIVFGPSLRITIGRFFIDQSGVRIFCVSQSGSLFPCLHPKPSRSPGFSAACPSGKIVFTNIPIEPRGESIPPTTLNPRPLLRDAKGYFGVINPI